jgi:hypothetical protein
VAARVLQFGWDDCYRGQVLKYAGYSVTKAETLESLSHDLQQTPDVAAILISEEDPRTTEKAVEVVRRHTKAPLILFRRLTVNIDESKFDHVFKGFAPPRVALENGGTDCPEQRFTSTRGEPPARGADSVPGVAPTARAV